jgi:hypothetical protein
MKVSVILYLLLAPQSTNNQDVQALIDNGHWKQARALVEVLSTSRPDDPRILYERSQIKAAFGDLEGAQKLAERAVELDSKVPDYHYQVAQAAGRRAQEAGIFRGLSLANRFKKETQIALTIDARHIAARFGMMMFYLQAPGLVGGDKDKARTMADETAKINVADGYLAKAGIAEYEKDFTNQEASYLKALEADPKRYTTYTALAGFYAADSRRRYDQVEKYASEALKIDSSRTGAYTLLTIVYAAQARWRELDAILIQAEKSVPDNLSPYFQAGRILLLGGQDLPRAEMYFRKYLTQEPEAGAPDHGAAHWRLGLVLELEDAKKDLRRLK